MKNLNFKRKMRSPNLSKIYTVIIFCFCTMFTIGQERYTPYDKVPGVPIMYKPAYTPTYPDWAKMLYQYPVDYHAICDKFDSYMLKNKGSKSAIIRYFKLWRPAIAPFVSTDGNIELPDFKALNNKKALNSKIDNKSSKSGIAQKSSLVDNSNWTFWGPKRTVWRNTGANLNAGDDAPWQSNIFSIDVAASNNNILYAGSGTGFLNKSIDNGFTWDLIGKDYRFGGGIEAVAIHPTNPDIVYVSNSTGVHKTIDGGITWQKMSSFGGPAIKIDPNNPQNIIAATFTGVYVSNDAGANWAKTHAFSAWDVEFKPDDSNIVYAISKKGAYFDLIVSTDGGASFISDVNFPTNLEEISGAVLAVTPANPGVVYLAMLSGDAASGTNFPLVYKAQALLSGGRVWTEQIKGTVRFGELSPTSFANGQGFYDLVLGVDPDDEDVLFFGTLAFFKSTNGGLDWTTVGGYGGNFNVHPDMQAIKMLGNGKIWLATDGGINFSSDNFSEVANWRVSIVGLHGSQMWGFDQGWNEDVIVGGRYHNGNVALKDIYNDKALRMGGAESPTGWIINSKPGQATFKDINKNYTTSIPETIDHVVANKKYAFTKQPNMLNFGARRGNLLEHPNYSETLYLGQGTGVWKSTDMGATWNILHNFSGNVMFIEISHKNPEVMYADVQGVGLYKTEDGGLNWVVKNNFIGSGLGTLSWRGYLHFVISPYDENTIYLCPQKSKVGWEGKVLKSTNGGDTWVNWSGTLPTSQYTKVLAIQPTSSGEDLVYVFNTSKQSDVSSIGESFFRKGNATNWEPFINNYPKQMNLLFAKPFYRDGKIRIAGTDGVWESLLAEPTFAPEVNAWAEKPIYACNDTIRIADHSMLNHSGATWNWIVTPTPDYISDATSKSPKIVVGAPGNYTVQQEVTQGGVTYTKTHTDMFFVNACQIACNTPGLLDQSVWSLLSVDSESNDGQSGEFAFDGNASTKWNSGFEPAKPDYPHEIQIDLGDRYKISEFLLTSHTQPNGRIKDAEIYISDDVNNWGQPVLVTFQNQTSQDPVVFSQPISGRYLRVVGLNSTDGDKFAAINEINLIGCNDPLPPPLVADFTANTTFVNVGDSVSFSDTSTSMPTAWSWSFEGGTPASSTLQNPTVVYNAIGTYQVSLTSTNAGGSDTKTVVGYITVTVDEPCESLLDQAFWSLLFVDSESNDNQLGELAFDGDPSSKWNSGFEPAKPDYPHEIQIDLGDRYKISEFLLTSHTQPNGRIKDAEIYISDDVNNWGQPVSVTFQNQASQDPVVFSQPISGRYLRVVGLNSTDGDKFATINEINLIGCDAPSLPLNLPPVADFAVNTTSVNVGDSVSFSDASTNTPTSWNWSFEGVAQASSALQNPTVTYNTPGTYQVSLTSTNAFGSDTKTEVNYIAVTACNTPGLLDQSVWSLLSVDSESNDGQLGELAFDGNPSSKWNSGFEPAKPDYPHEIQIDLGARYKISEFLLTSHTQPNGRIKDAEIYISDDVNNWGQPVLVTFQNQASQDPVVFSQPISGRYLRVVGLNSTDGDKFTTINEINLIGCNNPISLPPVADFTVNTTAIDEGDSVNFSDASSSTATAWSWSFEGGIPATSTLQNPTVSYNTTGRYQVSLTSTDDNGTSSKKTVVNYITVGCLGSLDQSLWSLLFVDSESDDNQPGELAFDGDPSSKWNSGFEPEKPDYPHEIQIDLGDRYVIAEFLMTSHTSASGRIKDAEIYISDDANNWGQPVLVTFQDQASQNPVVFSQPITGRYLRVVGLNSTDGDKFATINEINLFGCIDPLATASKNSKTLANQEFDLGKVVIYPNPVNDILNISLPLQNVKENNLSITIYSITGQQIYFKQYEKVSNKHIEIDISNISEGVYFVKLNNNNKLIMKRIIKH